MGWWSAGGATAGYIVSKTMQKIPFLARNYYIRRYKYTPFMIFFITLTYHGYKLMGYNKRKGVRELVKDPANLAD